MILRPGRLFSLAGLALVGACAGAPATPTGPEAVLDALGPDVRAAVWLSRAGQPPQLTIDVDRPMPCASSIKAAYLIEFFDAFADRLDEPMPGCRDVLARQDHPAVVHLGDDRRRTAARALGDASVRRIGEAMISGKDVDNATYNIAANVVTAHFGGPSGLTARLHARSPSWQGLEVRRYMLAARDVTGDNEVTARSLAAVHEMLANNTVPNADPRAVRAACEVLARADDAAGRKVFFKGGSLNSAPVTRVRAGWREDEHGATVYAVLLAGNADGAQLDAAARKIETLLLR